MSTYKLSDNVITSVDQYISWDNINAASRKHEFKVYKLDTTYRPNDDDCLVVGGSDFPFKSSNVGNLNINKLKLCLVNNLTVSSDSRFVFFPIGLPDFSHCQILGNYKELLDKTSEVKKVQNLVYKNIGMTNLSKRLVVESLNADHITQGNYNRTKEGRAKYIDEIYNHKFVLCPEGNGIDTHRLWETLYLKSVPIVCSPILEHFLSDLPILFIKNWNMVLDTNFLEEKYEEYMAKEWNLEKINLDYYVNLIIKARAQQI